MNAVLRPAVESDLRTLPEHMVGEIIAGELHAQPRPAPRHARAESRLLSRLDRDFDDTGGPGGWIILAEPELHLGPHVLVPDLAAWRRERLPELPETCIAVAPDWVCEILSPATARKDRVLKLPIYAEQGVAHAWLLDPLAQTVEIFRLENGHWLLVATHGGDETMSAEPFAAAAIDLARIWAW